MRISCHTQIKVDIFSTEKAQLTNKEQIKIQSSTTQMKKRSSNKKSPIYVHVYIIFDRIKARKDRDEQREEANKHKQIDC